MEEIHSKKMYSLPFKDGKSYPISPDAFMNHYYKIDDTHYVAVDFNNGVVLAIVKDDKGNVQELMSSKPL